MSCENKLELCREIARLREEPEWAALIDADPSLAEEFDRLRTLLESLEPLRPAPPSSL